jgi:hypothetical protein
MTMPKILLLFGLLCLTTLSACAGAALAVESASTAVSMSEDACRGLLDREPARADRIARGCRKLLGPAPG